MYVPFGSLLELMNENSFSGSGVVLSEKCLTLGWWGFLMKGELKMLLSESSEASSCNSLVINQGSIY